MRFMFPAILAVVAAAFAQANSASAGSVNEAANRIYVKALQSVALAGRNKDLSARLQQMQKAQADISQIVSDYPGSDLAVRLAEEKLENKANWSHQLKALMKPVKAAVFLQDFARRCLPKPSDDCLLELVVAQEALPTTGHGFEKFDMQELATALKAFRAGNRKPFEMLVRNQGKDLDGLAEPFFFAEKLDELAEIMFNAERVVLHGRREFSSKHEALMHLAQNNRRLKTPKVATAEMKRAMCASEGRFAALNKQELQSEGLFPALLRLTLAMCQEGQMVEPARVYLREFRRRNLTRMKNYPSPKNIYEMLEAFKKLDDVFVLSIHELVDHVAEGKIDQEGGDYGRLGVKMELPNKIRTYAMALLLRRVK